MKATLIILFFLLVNAEEEDCDIVSKLGTLIEHSINTFEYSGQYVIHEYPKPHGKGNLSYQKRFIVDGCFFNGSLNGKATLQSSEFGEFTTSWKNGRFANPTKGINVLTLDGGGVRGLIEIRMLQQIEHLTKMKIKDIFDVIAGTSTGGIIALGIQQGVSLEELEEMYTSMATQVFSKGISRWVPFLADAQKFVKPEFGNEKLTELLRKYLGDTKMENVCNNDSVVLVIAQCTTVSRPTAFTNKFPSILKHDNLNYTKDVKALEAALATSAAPTFFPSINIGGYNFIDGGIGNNNPSLLVLDDIRARFGKNAPIQLFVSLGTGYFPFELKENRDNAFDAFAQILSVATNTEKIHGDAREKLESEYHCSQGCYYRLNPVANKRELDETNDLALKELKLTAEVYGQKEISLFTDLSYRILASNYALIAPHRIVVSDRAIPLFASLHQGKQVFNVNFEIHTQGDLVSRKLTVNSKKSTPFQSTGLYDDRGSLVFSPFALVTAEFHKAAEYFLSVKATIENKAYEISGSPYKLEVHPGSAISFEIKGLKKEYKVGDTVSMIVGVRDMYGNEIVLNDEENFVAILSYSPSLNSQKVQFQLSFETTRHKKTENIIKFKVLTSGTYNLEVQYNGILDSKNFQVTGKNFQSSRPSSTHDEPPETSHKNSETPQQKPEQPIIESSAQYALQGVILMLIVGVVFLFFPRRDTAKLTLGDIKLLSADKNLVEVLSRCIYNSYLQGIKEKEKGWYLLHKLEGQQISLLLQILRNGTDDGEKHAENIKKKLRVRSSIIEIFKFLAKS